MPMHLSIDITRKKKSNTLKSTSHSRAMVHSRACILTINIATDTITIITREAEVVAVDSRKTSRCWVLDYCGFEYGIFGYLK